MKKIGIALIALVLLIVGFFWIFTEYINLGNEGIRVDRYGKNTIEDIEVVSGRVFYIPIKHRVYENELTVMNIDYPMFELNDRDGTKYKIDPKLSVRLNKGNSPKIYIKYMLPAYDVIESALLPYIIDIYRVEFANYTTDSIIANRNIFESSVEQKVANLLQKEGFLFENLTSGIQYPDELVSAITRKNTAVQDTKRKENELQSVIIDGKKLIETAKAEAEANILKQRTLTPLLIQQQFIEKWDGNSAIYGQAPNFFRAVQ